jgi:hypothetical protein
MLPRDDMGRLSPKANNGNETNSFTFDGLPKDKTSKTKTKSIRQTNLVLMVWVMVV